MRWRVSLSVLLLLFPAFLLYRSLQPNPSASHSKRGSSGAHRSIPVARPHLTSARTRDPEIRLPLVNTSESFPVLARKDTAILLENAWLDTASPAGLPIPESLRASSNPGAWLVQGRGTPSRTFRDQITQSGGFIVSYIPNNTFLVTGSAEMAQALKRLVSVQAVLPYHPFYKLSPALLKVALGQHSLPTDRLLNVLLFPGHRETFLEGVHPISEDSSPFGPVLTIPANLLGLCDLAQDSCVQAVEVAAVRTPANDLARVTLGIAPDPVSTNNYLGLTGSNVLVNVSDTGVDSQHPDLQGRIFATDAGAQQDTNGHGTHIAGIIAGNGSQSSTVLSAPGSPLPASPGQFRGKAPAASILSTLALGPPNQRLTDTQLLETAALSNAAVCNVSWTYGSGVYDFAAARFDAAVRDALPAKTGSQSLLVVAAAGPMLSVPDGPTPGVVSSPATAKNVISVGAVESCRRITNSADWLDWTDSSREVAPFSPHGNVEPGVEGMYGRLKPDLVAPGAFIISTRSSQWDAGSYYAGVDNSGSSSLMLSNLNSGLGPYYRYESGSSMAAASVSGVVALMREFFQTHMHREASPALIKALLLNGARPASGSATAFGGPVNNQGWGIPNLTNCLPAASLNDSPSGSPMIVRDQDPMRALETGQSRTWQISVFPTARTLPLRATLAWTDPPGNPVAGLKLVNDLDLIVTNLDTGQVFFGNAFDSSGQSLAWNGLMPVPADFVNNVEGVLLTPTASARYSVTVRATGVNVNAVSTITNGIVQDYALVVSAGDGQVPNALTIQDYGTAGSAVPTLTVLSNTAPSQADLWAPLQGQHAGANPQLGGGAVPLPGGGRISLGAPNQWRFYVFTNDVTGTNLAFLTFQTPPLSGEPETSSTDADVDLYVSTDPALIALDPVAISNAWNSVARGGAETVTLPNALPGPYYIGVKSESQRGAEFSILALASPEPFATTDPSGTVLLRGIPAPMPLADATSDGAGVTRLLALMPEPITVNKVRVVESFQHQRAGDLGFALLHNGSQVGLRPSGIASAPGQANILWDDTAMAGSGALHTSGPGTLTDFSGNDGSGQWWLSISDTVPGIAGTNDSFTVYLEPQPDIFNGITFPLMRSETVEYVINAPLEATNVQASVTLIEGTGPVVVRLCREGLPEIDCQSLSLQGPSAAGIVRVDKYTAPPLNAGRYRLSVTNAGPDPVLVSLNVDTGLSAQTPEPVTLTGPSPVQIADDALTVSTLLVTNSSPIVSVDVGVRINHPRVSDLVLTLVSPSGTRVLLAENRGGSSVEGLGADITVTNVTRVSAGNGPLAYTNVMEVGTGPGSVSISYDFHPVPDDMHVYRGTDLIFDSGLVAYNGLWTINYGPDESSQLTIVMNEGGNYDPNTAWDYDVTSTRMATVYALFTENSLSSPTPIKFATPPFTNWVQGSSGSGATNAVYLLPEQSLSAFAGENPEGAWTLEVRDMRAGAASPAPLLQSWELYLTLQDTHPLPYPLTHGDLHSALIPPGEILPLVVQVPAWAEFATNQLLSSSLPVQLWFNASGLPAGPGPGDRLILSGMVGGASVLSANTSPSLQPGAAYYLGVRNTNTAPVRIVFSVSFDVRKLVPGMLTSVAVGALPDARLFWFDVSSNTASMTLDLTNLTADLSLVLRKGLPLPSRDSFDYASFNGDTTPEEITVGTDSMPVPLSPGRWYVGVFNETANSATADLLLTTQAAPVAISEIIATPGGVRIRWSADSDAQFQVQWATRLDAPDWQAVPGGISSPGGAFEFLDDGSLTGAMGAARFYRVVQLR